MDIETGHQPKQERLRTRWTASLDKIFADLVVEQIQLGNRPNSVFDKKTWNHIRDSFNRQTDLNFNNNQLRKHLDVLRTRYYNIKAAFDQNEFAMDDSCCIGFDLWEDIGAQQPAKNKDCPIYEQLRIIFTESGVDGKYAQSSHYEGLISKPAVLETAVQALCPDNETSRSDTPSSSKHTQNGTCSENVNKDALPKGRKRPLETHSFEKSNTTQGFHIIAQAILDMIAASELAKISTTESDHRYSISNCIKTLDEIEASVDERVYYYAIDLFERPSLREMFICLTSNERRLAWLHEKFSNSVSSQFFV